MIRRDKVFELKIEEDDDVSGIDSISLVDEPAIEVMWVAFNKEKEYDFHIPEGEDEKYLTQLLSAGIPESEVLEEGWEVYKVENVTREHFSDPNASSSLDDEFLVRFKYAKNPDAPGNSIKSTTRDFCRQLVSQDLVYRIEDINFTNENGDSALTWRGGYNCRHLWQRILYKRTADIENNGTKQKGRVYTGPSYTVPGNRQPSTVVPTRPSFSKQEDFEVDVPHYTADGILYEGPTHKDASGRLMTGAVHTADSEYLYHENELPKKFQSYSDYPDSVKNNAKAVLKYVEENGWGSCGTPVGKARVNQLAKGEPISEETIKRMYSYLSRHKVDLESSKSYDDGCGKLMFDSWGGLTALSWAESKVNSFAKESFEKISIDYDDTLSTDRGKELAKRLLDEGKDLSIVTRRQESDLGPVKAVAKELGIPENKVHATNGKLKWETIKRLGINKHIDNNSDELKAIKENLPDVQVEQFDYNVGTISGYVDPGIGKKKKKLIEKGVAKPTLFDKEAAYLFGIEDKKAQYFAQDGEKQVVLGPAMIPNQKIYRKDQDGNPYYVFFSPETIKMIASKYMKNKYTDNNDQMHDGQAVKDVYVVESWIKESDNDKSTDYGFGDLPVGTWFVSMKINNPDIWTKVKEGQLNGFSVSGFFEEVAAFRREELFLQKVADILANIKD